MCAARRAQRRRPGRTHDTFPSHHPLASRAYDPAAAWSLPVKAAAAGSAGWDVRREPSRAGTSWANRTARGEPGERLEGSWAVGAVAIRSPPTEVKGHAVPRAGPPRAHIGNSAARTGAPPSFRPAKRAPPPVHHPPLRRAGLPRLPACAAVVPPNSPGARGRPCMNGPNPPAGPECEASAFLGVCCMPCPMGGPPCG